MRKGNNDESEQGLWQERHEKRDNKQRRVNLENRNETSKEEIYGINTASKSGREYKREDSETDKARTNRRNEPEMTITRKLCNIRNADNEVKDKKTNPGAPNRDGGSIKTTKRRKMRITTTDETRQGPTLRGVRINLQ